MSPKLQSIIRLGLCPSAPEGEWQAAAIAFFRTCRNNSIDPLAMADSRTKQDAPSPLMPFGKHKGKSIQWIARNAPDYAYWVLHNVTKLSPFVRTQLVKEMEAYR